MLTTIAGRCRQSAIRYLIYVTFSHHSPKAKSELARSIGRGSTAFLPGQTLGLPTKEECIKWYSEMAGWDPSPEIAWGDAFGIYRGSIIMQGIAARLARRQASSASATEYAEQMKPFGEVAWSLVQQCRDSLSESTTAAYKARL